MSFQSADSANESGRRETSGETPGLTQILHRARSGEPEDLEILIASVYRELRRTAQTMIGTDWSGQSLVATELVHETFLRLFGDEPPNWDNRRHFFGSAAIAMRRILIDLARKRHAERRIPKEEQLPIEVAKDVWNEPEVDLEALDDALSRLAKDHPRQAQVVELRFFVGLTEGEVAEILDLSRMTVARDWKVARLRLLKLMNS